VACYPAFNVSLGRLVGKAVADLHKRDRLLPAPDLRQVQGRPTTPPAFCVAAISDLAGNSLIVSASEAEYHHLPQLIPSCSDRPKLLIQSPAPNLSRRLLVGRAVALFDRFDELRYGSDPHHRDHR